MPTRARSHAPRDPIGASPLDDAMPTRATRVACAVALGALCAPASALKLAETFDDGALAGWTRSSEAKYTGARRATRRSRKKTPIAMDGGFDEIRWRRRRGMTRERSGRAREDGRAGAGRRAEARERVERASRRARRGGRGTREARRRSEIARARATATGRESTTGGRRRWMGRNARRDA